MVSKRTERDRGRPKKDGAVPFLQNPKRNYVMLMRGTMACMPNPSIRSAAKIIAAIAVGNQVGSESLPPWGREIVANCPAEMVPLAWGPVGDKANGTYINTKRGAKAGTIEGAAELIRKLDRQAVRDAKTDPDVARWLRCAVSGLILAFQDAPAAIVASTFRNSGDPELEASVPRLARFLNKPKQPKLSRPIFCTRERAQ
jgi:hypothetical protein